jgi:hypothetical protein
LSYFSSLVKYFYKIRHLIWKYAVLLFTLYHKALFMNDQKPLPASGAGDIPGDSLQDIKDIRRIMERSSRFISLSGLSGITAGIFALAGAWLGRQTLQEYYGSYNSKGFFSGDDFSKLKIKLIGLAVAVFVAAFASAFYFTWKRTREKGLSLWDHSSKKLFWNMAIPLVAGAAFILAMLRHDEWRFVAPSCLIFYGLALVNASKYTLTDIRYLGYCQIILGLANMMYPGYGLYFWAAGFGLLHIVYGIIMWYKYERQA